MYGFNNKDVAVRLRDLVLSGKLNRISRSSVMPAVARKQFNRMYMAMPTSEISAAVGGTAGTDFEVGYGTAKLLRLDVSTKYLLKHTPTRWREITVYNPYSTAIPSATTAVFQAIKDRHGKYWVGSDPALIFKQHVRFSLDEELTHADSSAEASIEYQIGPGAAHADVTIVVNNPYDATNSRYTYAGGEGATGWAVWDTGTGFYIFDMDCPAA